MATVTVELPDEVYEVLRRSPTEVRKDLLLAAALAREKVDAFAVDLEEFAREISHELPEPKGLTQ